MGPIYAHVWRDPASRHRVEAHPRVIQWMERVHNGDPAVGGWYGETPGSLDPLVAPIFGQTLAWVTTVVGAVNVWCAENAGAIRVPRALGVAPYRVKNVCSDRKIVTYTHWMAQRPLEIAAEPEVRAWLEAKGHWKTVEGIELRHPMKREGYREWLVQPA